METRLQIITAHNCPRKLANSLSATCALPTQLVKRCRRPDECGQPITLSIDMLLAQHVYRQNNMMTPQVHVSL